MASFTVNILKYFYHDDIRLEGDVKSRMTIIDQTKIKIQKRRTYVLSIFSTDSKSVPEFFLSLSFLKISQLFDHFSKI